LALSNSLFSLLLHPISTVPEALDLDFKSTEIFVDAAKQRA
jgi:hypothetical protein